MTKEVFNKHVREAKLKVDIVWWNLTNTPFGPERLVQSIDLMNQASSSLKELIEVMSMENQNVKTK